MKKTILLLFLAVFAVFSTKANPVDVNVARSVGAKFLSATANVQFRSSDLQLAKTYNIDRGDAAFYIFNAPNGFVIVSADDCAYPILGYNDNGRQFNPNNVPVQLQDILQEYQDQIQYGIENHLVADEKTAEQWRMVKTTGNFNNNRENTQVGPLLTTTWDQGQYYNAMCPEDANGPDGHVWTGCVATAMAQIIKYWGYPTSGRGIHSYNSGYYNSQNNYGILSVNYNTAYYDFVNMPDMLTNSSSQIQIQSVAKLIYHCGVAVNMTYGAGGSASYNVDARAAFINFFKYHHNLSFVQKQDFSNDGWDAMLHEDIDLGHPVYYGGIGAVGHAFVCDGYNDSFYHFNFGWSGNGDSWYLLDAINPGGSYYSNNQSAILGIVPDATSNVIVGLLHGTSIYTIDEPIEFTHTMGDNLYTGENMANNCNDTLVFVSTDNANNLGINVISFENQSVSIYDYVGGTLLANYAWNEINNPLYYSSNTLTAIYQGGCNYSGFRLGVSQDDGCRAVSIGSYYAGTNNIHIDWTENGCASQWQVEYGLKGFQHGQGTMLTVNDPVVNITGLQSLVDYDVYVRSKCSNNQAGPWSKKITLMTEAPYWIDIVTTEPVGYQVDNQGNVTISSAEGLAWLSKLSQSGNNFEGHRVTLTADVNMGQYKWKPIQQFKGVFDGQGHKINSMFIVENDNDAAMFKRIQNATIKNVSLINCYSKSNYAYGYTAGLVSATSYVNDIRNDTIMNCYVSGNIEGHGRTIAPIIAFSPDTFIINCASNCEINGNADFIGGLASDGEGTVVKNCYSASYINGSGAYRDYILNGGEMVSNCYGYVNRNGYMSIAGPNVSTINSTWFTSTNGTYNLVEPLYFESDGLYIENLLEALNAGVRQYNIQGLKLWTYDIMGINEGMPLPATEYIITCPNISNLAAHNVAYNNTSGVKLSWNEAGEATEWEIKYRIKDSTDYVHIFSTNNPDTICGLNEGTTYCFSVRPLCSSTNHGDWSEEINHVFDRLYCTDIVTSEPAGYVMDDMGNVSISSAEGLAWLVSVVNGLNGQTTHTFEGKRVTITQDLNLGQFKWKPINNFKGTFDGCGHTISDLYVNELTDRNGFLGRIEGGVYSNIVLSDANVKGKEQVGMLFGSISNAVVTNCNVSGNVYGERSVGGLAGSVSGLEMVNMCSSSGVVESEYGYVGGLFGGIFDGNIKNSYSRCDVTILYPVNNSGVVSDITGGLIGICTEASVENCYSSGNVYGAIHTGGAIGFLDRNSIVRNCYTTGMESEWGYGCMYTPNGVICGYNRGVIIGQTREAPTISNCYGLYDESSPLVGKSFDGGVPIIYDTIAFAVNSGNMTLLGGVTIGLNYYTDMIAALNAWVDANNANGEYLHWEADAAIVNDGFPIFEALPTFEITATANPTAGGTVLGAGTYNQGDQVTLTATANAGYHFVNWTLNGSTVSTASSISITITQNANYVANFELNSYQITATSNPSSGGTVTGSGIYNYGDQATVSVTLNDNFIFVSWTENGVEVSNNETYSFVVETDRNLVANLVYHDGMGEHPAEEFLVYPNPANDIIFIESEKEMNRCEIYNSVGLLVYSNDNCQQKMQINFSVFPAGYYIIKIISCDKVVAKKLVRK